MPPVDQEHRLQSALSIRRLVALTGGADPPLICISPEGKSNPDLALSEPPPGTGVFLQMLTHGRLPVMPVGIYEDEDGALVAHFGAPFRLLASDAGDRQARDRAIVRCLMVAIGSLLPERMWGAYRHDLEKARHAGTLPAGPATGTPGGWHDDPFRGPLCLPKS